MNYHFKKIERMIKVDNKTKFIEIYNQNIKRTGSDELLDWLIQSDFFTAPASTRFHGAHEGGLCEHSINVYNRLISITPKNTYSSEVITICSLLHDICKTNFYKTDTRNQKINGVWEQVPYYTIDDTLPYGHGEKSVYIISNFMKLSEEEAMAIRWHMGGFDEAVRGGSYSLNTAYDKYPLCVLLQTSDMLATYIDERMIP